MTIRPPSSVAHSNGGAVLCCVHLIECITCKFLPVFTVLVGVSRIKDKVSAMVGIRVGLLILEQAERTCILGWVWAEVSRGMT